MPERDSLGKNRGTPGAKVALARNRRVLESPLDVKVDASGDVRELNTSPAVSNLNVAFVVIRFNKGGMERCIARVVNQLDRERFSPSIVCLDRSGTAEDWLSRSDISIVELR